VEQREQGEQRTELERNLERNLEELERERYTRALMQIVNKRVVTMGGGTGPFGVLSSLKQYPCSIAAIVTMADSGGSSRRLMDEFGQLPVGDVRQALLALSRKGVLWRDVFTFRFRKGHGQRAAKTLDVGPIPTASASGASTNPGAPTAPAIPAHAAVQSAHGVGGDPNDSQAQRVAEQAGVTGHSLGNLIISALQEINDGNLLHAIEDAQELLDTAGKVLPVTLAHTTLCAELADGTVIRGETDIDTRGSRPHNLGALPPIQRLFLDEQTPPCDEAIRAIRRADVIVIGPGSRKS